jgi:hypothetical protein
MTASTHFESSAVCCHAPPVLTGVKHTGTLGSQGLSVLRLPRISETLASQGLSVLRNSRFCCCRLVAGKGKQPETGFLQRIGIRSATIGAPPDAEPDHQAVRDDSSSSSSSKDSGDSINKDAGASLRDLAQPQVQPEDAHEVQRQRQPQQQQQQQRPEQQQQRQRQQQQQFMVHFVTAPAADAATKLAPVIAMLLQRCPSVVSVVRTDATGSVGDGRSSSTRGPGVGTVGTNNNSSSAGSLKRSAKRASKAVKAAERRARRGAAATYQVFVFPGRKGDI